MNRLSAILFVAMTGLMALAASAADEVKVEVKNTHVCCAKCEQAVAKVLEKAGVKGAASKKEGNIQFTAADEKSAQLVLDSLAAAGFHGVVDSKTLQIKDDSGAKEGKVTSLSLKGLHNCCGMCNTAIKGAVKKVEGVESDDATANVETLTVKGNFDAKALIKSLNDAGFHATVAQ